VGPGIEFIVMFIRPLKLIRNTAGIMALLISSQSVFATNDIASTRALFARLDAQQDVAVIVTLASVRNSAPRSILEGWQYRKIIRQEQQDILDQLPGISQWRAKLFQNIPQIAMRVERAQLQALLDIPGVQIVADVPHKLLLTQSVPRVFPTQLTSPYDGNNQWAVAVLDSGVNKAHPFLSNKVLSEACFSNLGGVGVPGENSVSTCPGGGSGETGPGTGEACTASTTGCDHGTRVAGVVAGESENFNGVARAGKIIAVQVTTQINPLVPGINDTCELAYGSTNPCVLAYSSDIIAALDYVYTLRDTYKIAAVNLSLGYSLETGACDTQPEKVAIDKLKNAGIATVIAAGNNGSTYQMSIPACISSAIAVGSTSDIADTVSTFSNSSVELDLYAPGENISSSIPDGTYGDYSGTSMAAPHVAGAWAVLKHAQPEATVDEIEALLQSHGPEVTKPGTTHTRRRLALSESLNALCGGGACAVPTDESLCMPIKASNGKVVVICL